MKVLVADDSRAMRMIVIRTLRQSGITIDDVREAVDGADALAAVPEFRPDLILSDWNMPNMTGIELLTALRDRGDATPFGFVTSESNPDMKERALAAGAGFVITKPFDGDRLADVIGSMVG